MFMIHYKSGDEWLPHYMLFESEAQAIEELKLMDICEGIPKYWQDAIVCKIPICRVKVEV